MDINKILIQFTRITKIPGSLQIARAEAWRTAIIEMYGCRKSAANDYLAVG